MDASFSARNASLTHIIDRLSIEKALATNEKPLEGDFKTQLGDCYQGLISPDVFEKYRCISYHVPPGGPGKVRRREYTRKSKGSEGASFMCTICQNFVYKLYSTTTETNGTRESVQVCRKCFVEQNGGKTYSTNCGEVRVRPHFDHSLGGNTFDRASNSWHFIRKGFVQKKTLALLNHRCNEKEYSDIYGSDSGGTQSSDEDEIEDEASRKIFVPKKVLLPFQMDDSYCSSKSDCDTSPTYSDCAEINQILELKEFSIILENVEYPPLSGEKFSAAAAEEKHNDGTTESTNSEKAHVDNEMTEKLLKNNNIEICLSPTIQPHENEKLFSPLPFSEPDCYFFDDKPSNFTIAKEAKRKPKYHKSVYKGVCGLVTVLNSNSGRFVQNVDNNQLYDRQGFPRSKKDLPPYVFSNQRHTLGNIQQEKKNEIDHFLHNDQSGTYVRPRRKGLKYVNGSPTMKSSVNNATKEKKKYCVICKDPLGKWHVTYERKSAPMGFFKYFPAEGESIHVCPKCNKKPRNTGTNNQVSMTNPKEKISLSNYMSSKRPFDFNSDESERTEATGSATNKVTDKKKTSYYILQTGANREIKSPERVASDMSGGQIYRIDSEINFNNLVKENENAVKINDKKGTSSSDQWPSILKRSVGGSNRHSNAGKYKIIGMYQQPKAAQNRGVSYENLGRIEGHLVTMSSVKTAEGTNYVLQPLFQTVNSLQSNTSSQLIQGPSTFLSTNAHLAPSKNSLSVKVKEQLRQNVNLNSTPVLASEICLVSSSKQVNHSSVTSAKPNIQINQRQTNSPRNSAISENLKRKKEIQSFTPIDSKCIRI